jgi:peptidoglycan hydrolase CwlO-like protein
MPNMIRRPRVLATALLAAAGLLGTAMTSTSAGDLQSQISAKQSAASALQSQITDDAAKIASTTNGLSQARAELTQVQAELHKREAQLKTVQTKLLKARAHLLDLENRLQTATQALSANLVSAYENNQPDMVSVLLDARGFNDLIEQLNFMKRISRQDAQILSFTRTARAEVARQAQQLGALEARDRSLAEQVLSRRNQIAALKAALLKEQIAEVAARNSDKNKLAKLNDQLGALETKAAQQAEAAAATGNADVGGITIDTNGMVQPPPGAPEAIKQVIAAGNAIATLPYIYGGGHASFQADGYDCSGSVSYALAAAGLVTSPMVSGQFENWGSPGPGKWITIYANADHVWMTVAGWRFDTVALAEYGTRWHQGGGEFSDMVVVHPTGL